MKNLSLACVLAFTGLFLAGACIFAADEPKAHQLDYNNLKSKDIEVRAGETIVVVTKFSGDIALIDPMSLPTVKTTDGKTGEVLDAPAGDKVKRLDKDTVQLWSWTANRAGTAEIAFTNPGGKIVAKMKVTAKRSRKNTEYDLYSSSKLPASLDLKVGEKVTFVSKAGHLYAVKFVATVATTDGKTGDVLDSNVFTQSVRPDGLQTEYVYEATRAGTCTIEVNAGGKKVVKTITVTVK